jgi:hypothetical protein
MNSEKLQAAHFIIVAYGESYVDIFLKTCVPNLLGLLPEIPGSVSKNSVLKIFTSPQDAVRIAKGLEAIKFKSQLSYEILDLINPNEKDRYGEMNRMHQIAVAAAWRQNAGLIVLFPDSIFSLGSFENLFKVIDKGYRFILAPPVRTVTESLFPLLLEIIEKDPQGYLKMNTADAVRLSLAHFHPIQSCLDWKEWSNEAFDAYPYAVLKRIDQNGLLLKTFLGHPLFVWPTKEIVHYEGTIDMHFIRKAFPDFKELYVISDSDELFTFDLSPRKRSGHCKLKGAFPSLKFLEVVNNRKMFSDYHLRCALVTSRIHDTQCGPEWDSAEKEFNRQIDPIIILGLAQRALLSAYKKTKSLLSLLWIPCIFASRIIYLFFGQKLSASSRKS